MKVSKVENDSDVSTSRVNKLYSDLVGCFNKNKANVKEILLAYGNLGYTLGASIEGYKDKGPSAEELNLLYATKPTVGVALMIQGLQTTLWVDDLNKKIEEINEDNRS